MEFYFFHLMPWPYLPEDFEKKYSSAWVTCPNSLYDPEKGHALYNRYLDELEHAADLGFDGLGINEHHQNAYGNMPSPNIIAACLARRTTKAKILILGNALPLYDHPLRVAEEIAMLDVITGGRIISGMVVGGGPEFYSYNVNPAYARERFREAHDLIVRAWTEEGPFSFEGKHYTFRYVNLWPRPVQKPHPPVWVPGVGSLETIEWVAEHGYPYAGLPFFHYKVFQRAYGYYRECLRKHGRTPTPKMIAGPALVYVAETDEQARKEFEPHFWYFVRKLLLIPPSYFFPPGYTSARSLANIQKGFTEGFLAACQTWKEIEDGRYAFVGSPATVRDMLKEYVQELGIGLLICGSHIGSLPHELTVKSMDLFASEVMPTLRPLNEA